MTKTEGYRNAKLGEKNPLWKGNNVGYIALHQWVKARIENTGICAECLLPNAKLDLANISQEYKRDLNDWELLCRRCHMTKDGRLERFRANTLAKHEKRRQLAMKTPVDKPIVLF